MQVKHLKQILEGFNDSDNVVVTDLKYSYEVVELRSKGKSLITLVIE